MKILISALLAILCVTAEAQAQEGFFRNDALAGINGANLTSGSAAVDGSGRLATKNQTLARTTEPTAVTTNTNVQPLADVLGKQVIAIGSIPELTWRSCSVANTGTSSVAIRTASGSGLRYYVAALGCQNNSAVASAVTFLENSTAFWVGSITALSVGGSYSQVFTVPVRFSLDQAINFQMTTTATSTICCAVGYTSSL